MNHAEAVAFLRSAVGDVDRVTPSAWADLGAGGGAFARALADLLPPHSVVYAVDSDPAAISALRDAAPEKLDVIPVLGDFTSDVAELRGVALDGVLLANALHFVRDQAAVLKRVASMVRAGGRVIVIEYERRAASRWVPYPLPVAKLESLARDARLGAPRVTARRPSRYQGELYAAVVDVGGQGSRMPAGSTPRER